MQERDLDVIDRARELLTKAHVETGIIDRTCVQLRREYGGVEGYVRKREYRDSEIRQALESGQSAAEIARQYDRHPATIRRKRSAWLG